jgi:hypothetical protein
MRKITLFATGLILLAMASCSKSDHAAQPGQQDHNDSSLQETKTVVADRKITSVTPEAIQFDTSRSDLKAGDILVSGVAANAPSGFLRKVASVTTGNGQTTVETTGATLADALANTMNDGETVGKNFTFNFDDFRASDNRKASSPDVNMVSRGSIAIHETYTDPSGKIFTIDGTLNLSPEAGGKIYFSKQKKPDGSTEPGLDSLAYYMKAASGLKVRAISETSSPFQKEWVVDSFPSSTPVTVWLGTFPIVLRPSITVSLGVDFKLDANSVYEYQDSSKSSEEIAYNPTDQWVLPKTNYFHVVQDTGYIYSTVNGTCKIYLKIESSVTMYDTKTPTASISESPYGNATVTPETDLIDCTINGGVATGASFSALSFFDKPLIDKSWDQVLNIPEWTILHNWSLKR